jgi:fructose-bisphosphate aldolase class II
MNNCEGGLKIEGEVGNKAKYDPRTYMKLGETALAERVKQAVTDLRGVETTLFGSGG